ncbi:NlpC/P60 family protein [Streptomyces xiamenensis]
MDEDDLSRLADHAIAWAEAHLGSTAYATRCLAFVEDAYERANDLELFGGDTAHESAVLYEAATRTGPPPRGAFVFYDSVGELLGARRNWGHVGIALGDGRVIHAWDRVRIDPAEHLEDLTPPPGWDLLRGAGWAPAERFLRGSRPRRWTTDAPAAARDDQATRFGSGT